MEEQTIHLFNESILPVNETTVTLGDKLLLMDSLAFPLTMTETQKAVDRFPVKLTMSCLLIVEDGMVRLNINFMDSVITAGSCAFIGQEAIVEGVEVEGDARVILVMFSRNHGPATSSFFQNVLQIVACKLHVKQMTMLKQVYYMMRTILIDSAFALNWEECAVSCLDLMGNIIGQENASQRDVKASRADEIVSRFLRCVQKNYREHRDLGFYADQLGLSLKYMSHVIYEKTGRHPSRWIKDYVILEAKTMLRSGRYTVQQVAEELHFPNQSFFGKYFKEAVGVSPKKWK